MISKIVILFIIVLFTACQKIDTKNMKEEKMIEINKYPLIKDIPDPYVFKSSNGMFYAYGTTDPLMGYRTYESSDLINWQKKGLVYRSPNTWQSGDFWAPEVYEYKDKYYLFYTARDKNTKSLKLGVAISDKPDGPFKDVSDKPMFDFGYAMIDAHVYFDDNGDNYLYYSRDCSENVVNGYNTSQVYAVKLSDDLLSTTSDPLLLLTPDNELETKTGQYRWNEAPFVIKHKDIYYLMYSSGFFAESTYHISYATSNNPLGPFTKSLNNPLLKSYLENGFSGPGHNSIFEKDGELYIAYHTHMYKDGGDRRQMNINKIGFTDDGQIEILEPLKNF